MDNSERENIIGCLRIIVHTAGQYTNDHRGLARLTKVVMDALDKLFLKEGLEPIGNLFKPYGDKG